MQTLMRIMLGMAVGSTSVAGSLTKGVWFEGLGSQREVIRKEENGESMHSSVAEHQECATHCHTA